MVWVGFARGWKSFFEFFILPCLYYKNHPVIIIAEARLTVATDKNDDIRAMQKGLNGSFSVEEIKKVIKASIDNGKEIREILYKATK